MPTTASRSRPSRLRRAAALFLAPLLAGCGGADAEREEAETVLRGRVLTDTLALALPNALFAAAGTVVVQDTRGTALRAFDASGAPLAAGGRGGSGPGEFVDPWDVSGRPGRPDELWVYDARLERLTPYSITALRAGGRAVPARDPLSLAGGAVVESPRWLDDSTLVALAPMLRPGDRRFVLFRADGTPRRIVGEPPPGRAAPAFVRQQAYGGPIAVHPGGGRFVLAGRFAGRLEGYAATGALLFRARVPDAFEPDFTPARDGLNLVHGPKSRQGYVDLAASADRVYALFSGEPFRKEGSYLGREVHVFDWEGRLVRRLRLDVPALRLAVDPGAAHLYTLRHEPQPGLARYDLPAGRP